MITLQEMAVLNSLYALVDLKNQLLLISFFLLLFLMHYIATHNIGLESYCTAPECLERSILK